MSNFRTDVLPLYSTSYDRAVAALHELRELLAYVNPHDEFARERRFIRGMVEQDIECIDACIRRFNISRNDLGDLSNILLSAEHNAKP